MLVITLTYLLITVFRRDLFFESASEFTTYGGI